MNTSSIQRIHSRMNEYQPISDINSLCKQWNDDKQWGRAVLWQTNHPMQYGSLNGIELNLIQTAQITFYEKFVIKKYIDDTGKPTVRRMDMLLIN